MHNEQSGARKHHKPKGDGEVLSPVEAAAVAHGQIFKRLIRAAAAMQGIYDDVELAKSVHVHRRTVAGWWADEARMSWG